VCTHGQVLFLFCDLGQLRHRLNLNVLAFSVSGHSLPGFYPLMVFVAIHMGFPVPREKKKHRLVRCAV